MTSGSSVYANRVCLLRLILFMTPLYDVRFRCVRLPCFFVEVSVVHDVIVLMLFMTSLYARRVCY